jgi:hypothetical protein
MLDWEKFFSAKGDIVGVILQKAYGFIGSGSHTEASLM